MFKGNKTFKSKKIYFVVCLKTPFAFSVSELAEPCNPPEVLKSF